MYDEEDLARIRRERDRWQSVTLEPSLDRRGERRDRFATVSDLPIERLYTPLDVADDDYLEQLGFPGEPPYTRGVYSTMYRGRTWTMRQFAGFGSARETNERFRYLIDAGQTGLSVAFDMPTLMGLDSTDTMSMGEVGKEGVAVDSIRDMRTLFDEIDLATVSTSFTINPSAAVIYAMYIALADERGVPRSALRGTLQNDMFKEFIAQKEWVIPPDPSLELVTDIIEFSTTETPAFHPISVSGYHIREAGSTAIQEAAFTLANGFAYIEHAIDRGLEVDTFAPKLSFFFNCHNSFLEEVAKFRAVRRIYATLMEEWFGASADESRRLKFHTQTAGQSLTAQQPLTNIVRVTIQAMAAIAGGTQSLHTNSFDEALALPSEEAVRVALRTQQILAEESGICDSIDPLGGSFAIESLTNQIEADVQSYLDRIRAMGDGSIRDGVLAGIDDGYFQREIQDAAFDHQQRVEDGELVIVGVNQYRVEESTSPDIHHVDEHAVRERQEESLKAVRRERDNNRVTALLEQLRMAITDGKNTIPTIIEAVKAEATVGEIMAVFEAEHGSYTEPTTV